MSMKDIFWKGICVMQTKSSYWFALLIMVGLSSCKHVTEPPILSPRYFAEVWVINVDGTNNRPLTDEKRAIQYANYLPDGSKIIYGGWGTLPQPIYSMNVDGTEKTLLVNADIFPPSDPVTYIERHHRIMFTSDSKFMVYSTYYDENYMSDLFLYSFGGKNTVKITDTKNAYSIFDFNLSSDSRKVIYSTIGRDASYNNSIVISDLDGGNKTTIKTFGTQKPLYAQFLPTDNNVVVYVLGNETDGYSICRFSLTDAAHVTVVAKIAPFSHFPIITKNNLMVLNQLFLSRRVYSVNLLTGEQGTILSNYASDLSLSIDGGLIVTGNGSALTLSQLDGLGMKSITPRTNSEFNRTPYLSPSNTQITYRSISTISE